MDDFDKSCEQLSIPKFKVGDDVRLSADHPWADHLGTVVRFETIKTTKQKNLLFVFLELVVMKFFS